MAEAGANVIRVRWSATRDTDGMAADGDVRSRPYNGVAAQGDGFETRLDLRVFRGFKLSFAFRFPRRLRLAGECVRIELLDESRNLRRLVHSTRVCSMPVTLELKDVRPSSSVITVVSPINVNDGFKRFARDGPGTGVKILALKGSWGVAGTFTSGDV